MIETNAKRDIVGDDMGETTKMSLSKSVEVEAHIVKILTENYKYPVQSHIREVVSNHWDSHIEAGKPEHPINVKLYKNSTGDYTLETSDEGLGLNEEEFDRYYMQLGESSKRGKPNLIGGKGAGAKAILSFADSYEVICRKGGIECKFLVFKGESVPERTKIYEKPTESPNGVIVKVNLDYYSFQEFRDGIKQQLCYFPTVVINIEGDNFDYLGAKIYENDLFKWSEVYPDDEMHISFGVTHYTIDWQLLGIPKINIPIAIKIPLDCGIDVFFNRESIIYNKFSKEYILNKIKLIADFFCEKYNESWKEYDNIIEAWNKIGIEDKTVNIANQEFIINPLIKYSNIVPKELKIKGIELQSPEKWKQIAYYALNEYQILVEYDWSWRVKHLYSSIVGKSFSYKLIEVDGVPTGRIKKYLLEKYKGRLLFIKKAHTRRLGNTYTTDETSYNDLLHLNNHPKENWRKLIIEYLEFVEKPFKNLIIDEKGVENKKEYQEWLIKYKEELKNKRNSGYSVSNYVKLDKKQGDITLHYCRKSPGRNSYGFEKKAVSIKSIANNKNVHIYFPIEEKDKALNIKKLLKDKYSIVLIGKREVGIVKSFTNFISMEELDKSAIFKRICSAILFKREIDNFKRLYSNKTIEIIETCLDKFRDDLKTLEQYTDNYYRSVDDDELLEGMLKIAEEHKLFDYSLFDVYKRVQREMKKYDFLNLIQTPHRWDDEKVAEYNKLINKLLYLKIRNGEIDDFIITPVKKEVVSAPEEMGEQIAEIEEVEV